jgi:hypothetical protein
LKEVHGGKIGVSVSIGRIKFDSTLEGGNCILPTSGIFENNTVIVEVNYFILTEGNLGWDL